MAHDYLMLSTKDTRADAPTKGAVSSEADLRFISQNERLEGFSGEITEELRQHRPDLKEIEAVARRFGAQIPKFAAPAKS